MLPGGCVRDCPACAHRELSADESLARKLTFLKAKLPGWAELISEVRSVPDGERLGYRNKVSLAARWNGTCREAGVLRRDELIPIPGCPVHSPKVNALLRVLNHAIPADHEFPLVRYVISDAQITLIVKSRQMPPTDWLTDNVKAGLAENGAEGLWIHLHPSAGRKVFGKGNWHLIWGNPTSVDENGLLYGPASFQQLLPSLAGKALDLAEAFLNPGRDVAVADLYSGTGSSIRRWSRAGAITIGVEQGGDAVEFAMKNSPGVQVLRGSCRHRIPQLSLWDSEVPESYRRLLYANPPRTGLEPEVIDWITGNYRPERLAYLSCNASTLNRDLQLITEKGYSVRRIIPFDFFPQTRHVECLALIGSGG